MSGLRLSKQPVPDLDAVDGLDEPGGLQSQWTGGSALATRSATVVLWGALIAGPIGLVLAASVALGGSAPAVAPAAPAPDTSGEQVQVSEFAGRFVSLWLRSVRGQEAALAPYVRTAQLTLPQVAWTAGPTVTAEVQRVGEGDWRVVVAVPVTTAPMSSASSPSPAVTSTQVLRYFAVPVRAEASGLVALALPAPVAAPPAATAPPALSYRYRASPTDPAVLSVQQFLDALLTGQGDVTRYVAPGLSISAISPAPYRTVKVTDVATDRELTAGAPVPADGTGLRLLVSATAATGPEQFTTVQYPLRLGVRGGRWEVTALDPVPAAPPAANANAASAPAAPQTPVAQSTGPQSVPPTTPSR